MISVTILKVLFVDAANTRAMTKYEVVAKAINAGMKHKSKLGIDLQSGPKEMWGNACLIRTILPNGLRVLLMT